MLSKKVIFLIVLIGFALFVSCHKETETEDIEIIQMPAGLVITTEVISSEILNREMNYSIYLPPGYETSGKNYPVLYLLHGMWGNYTDWVNNGMASTVNNAINYNDAKEMIVVMPDGLDAFYCNNYNGGSMRYEDFMIQEFIPQIESLYRINSTKSGRAIAGLSMGGYGATFHAFKRPEMFCCCYAMSGALDMGDSAPDIKEILSSKSHEELENLPEYSMECGTEDYLVFSSNESFHTFLNEKEINHNYIARNGAHDWNFWMTCLPKVINLVSNSFE